MPTPALKRPLQGDRLAGMTIEASDGEGMFAALL